MVSRPPAVVRLARQHPASYVAFDILTVDGTDVRSLAWRDRRALLDELAGGFEPPIQVSPITEDYATALEWFTALSAWRAWSPRAPDPATGRGSRAWVKVKHRSQVDGIVGAVIGPVMRPEVIVVAVTLATACCGFGTQHRAQRSAGSAAGGVPHRCRSRPIRGRPRSAATSAAERWRSLTWRQTWWWRSPRTPRCGPGAIATRLLRLRPDLLPADVTTD